MTRRPIFESLELGAVISLRRGHDLSESQRKPGSIPVVSSSGITGFHNAAICDGPGVVTGRYGTLGLAHYVNEPYWPLNTTLYVENFKGNDPRYVSYLLGTLNLAQYNGAGAVPGVNRNVLHRLSVLVPSYDVQVRIVANLSTYDHLIENNQRRIKLLEEAARRLYREWFVALHFPGHEQVKVVDGMPQGWVQATLGDAMQLQRGFDLPSGARKEGAVPIIASTGVTGFHDEARVSGPGVVTGRSGTLGAVHFVHEDFWPLNTSLWVREFRLVTPLVAYFMLLELGLSQFNSGASVPTLDRKAVHPMPAMIPSKPVQTAFEEVAGPMFSQIRVLNQAASKAKQARDALLPHLMSGALAV